MRELGVTTLSVRESALWGSLSGCHWPSLMLLDRMGHPGRVVSTGSGHGRMLPGDDMGTVDLRDVADLESGTQRADMA